jgi:hypothetical protein
MFGAVSFAALASPTLPSVPMTILRTALAIVICCSACGFGSDKQSGGTKVGFSADSAAAIVLAPGDVKITSTNGAVVLAVLGDSIRMQLSDSLRNSVKQEIDSSGKDSKLASAILKSVGSVVNSALGFVVRAHVKDVKNLRYEEGNIQFDIEGGNVDMKTSGKHSPGDAQFSEEDARKFIEAVERRQRNPLSVAR